MLQVLRRAILNATIDPNSADRAKLTEIVKALKNWANLPAGPAQESANGQECEICKKPVRISLTTTTDADTFSICPFYSFYRLCWSDGRDGMVR
jgi:hypothetical protein